MCIYNARNAANHKRSHKTLGPLAASLVTTLHELNKVLFDIGEVKAITGLSDASARSFVRSLVDRGVVARLKPGLFILAALGFLELPFSSI